MYTWISNDKTRTCGFENSAAPTENQNNDSVNVGLEVSSITGYGKSGAYTIVGRDDSAILGEDAWFTIVLNMLVIFVLKKCIVV